MSLSAMRWALDLAPAELPAPARHVLLVIADAVNDETRECWIGVPRIMSRTGLSRRTVQRALLDLGERGIVRRDVQAAPDARMTRGRETNLYTWLADGMPTRGGKPVDNDRPWS